MISEEVQQLQDLIEQQAPESADAIVWLQGDQYDRAAKVLELWQQGFAPRIILTGNDVLVGSGTRPGENNVSLSDMEAWLRKNGVPGDVLTLDQQAMNTKEQALTVMSLAKKLNFTTILLVGSRHHQLRPFLTFLRQAETIGWMGRIINQPALCSWDTVPSGRDKTSGDILIDEVQKLSLYTNDVASVQQGIQVLNAYSKKYILL